MCFVEVIQPVFLLFLLYLVNFFYVVTLED